MRLVERAFRTRLRDWRLLLEAAFWLVAARIALKVLPVTWIVRWIQRPLKRRQLYPAGAQDLERLRWAVTAFSRNAPLRLVCFPQALALHAMLRGRTIASEVVYGVARPGAGGLQAHAWLRIAGRIWIGGEVSPSFTVLDSWQPESSPSEKTMPD
jgi:hypothetical protein